LEKTWKRNRDMERAKKPGPLSKFREESSEAFEAEELDEAPETSQLEATLEVPETREKHQEPEDCVATSAGSVSSDQDSE
jgi:hypothetical protein